MYLLITVSSQVMIRNSKFLKVEFIGKYLNQTKYTVQKLENERGNLNEDVRVIPYQPEH